MTERAWWLLLAAIILAVFYPAFSAEICNLDDAQMVDALRQIPDWRIRDVFLPGSAGGLYYRPLLGLTFFINNSLFNLNPFVLHAENVLLHLGNVLLVYFLLRQILSLQGSNVHPASAFLGALLFGLHPMVTESTNWISGRTDLLMGFFLLLCTLLLISYRRTGVKILPWLAAFFFLCALLSKELAIAFLPGFFMLLSARLPGQEGENRSSAGRYKKILFFLSITVLVVGTFFLLRHLAFSSNSDRIRLTFLYMQINPEHTLFLFLRAIGFYLKKLVVPWPLNFAIVEVDPLYELLAIPLLVVSLYIAWQGTLKSSFFIIGLLLFTPALLIGLNQIAWTPYAERYVYCTAAFVSVSVILYLESKSRLINRKLGYGVLGIFILLMAGTTLQRNIVWQTNEGILADTARKAPSFKIVQWLYGALLYDKGHYDEALPYVQRAVDLPGTPLDYHQLIDVNLGYIFLRTHKTDKAISVFENTLKKTKGTSVEAREGLVDSYYVLWSQAQTPQEKKRYLSEMVAYGRKVFEVKKDPVLYYTLGKAALLTGETGEARQLFQEAIAHMGVADPFFFPAKMLLGACPN